MVHTTCLAFLILILTKRSSKTYIGCNRSAGNNYIPILGHQCFQRYWFAIPRLSTLYGISYIDYSPFFFFIFFILVNGNWGPWSQCSQTCGFGLRFRQRLCDNPSPKNVGNKCVSAMEEDRCNIQTCSTTPSPNTNSPTTPLTSTTTPIPSKSLTISLTIFVITITMIQ